MKCMYCGKPPNRRGKKIYFKHGRFRFRINKGILLCRSCQVIRFKGLFHRYKRKLIKNNPDKLDINWYYYIRFQSEDLDKILFGLKIFLEEGGYKLKGYHPFRRKRDYMEMKKLLKRKEVKDEEIYKSG